MVDMVASNPTKTHRFRMILPFFLSQENCQNLKFTAEARRSARGLSPQWLHPFTAAGKIPGEADVFCSPFFTGLIGLRESPQETIFFLQWNMGLSCKIWHKPIHCCFSFFFSNLRGIRNTKLLFKFMGKVCDDHERSRQNHVCWSGPVYPLIN